MAGAREADLLVTDIDCAITVERRGVFAVSCFYKGKSVTGLMPDAMIEDGPRSRI